MSESLENLKAALKDLPPENLQALLAEVTASGRGAVAIARDATGAKIVTGSENILGDNNRVVIYQRMDAETLRQVLLEILNFQAQKQQTIQQIVREELAEHYQPVTQGLNALIELMRFPQVCSAVSAFQVDFRAVCKQINLINHYKKLHDLLHTVEIKCYSDLLYIIETQCLSEKFALRILKDHAKTLEYTLSEVQSAINQMSAVSIEILWIKDLESASYDLHSAIKKLEIQHLEESAKSLGKILGKQPSRINNQLKSAADSLRLISLAESMKVIWEKISLAKFDEEKIDQFKLSIDTLESLGEQLELLVQEHDCLQYLDDILRRVKKVIEIDLNELKDSIEDIDRIEEYLLQLGQLAWKISLKQDIEDLRLAIFEKDSAEIKSCFQNYRSRAIQRFYEVDLNLYKLCEHLKEVGAPLSYMLRMIE